MKGEVTMERKSFSNTPGFRVKATIFLNPRYIHLAQISWSLKPNSEGKI